MDEMLSFDEQVDWINDNAFKINESDRERVKFFLQSNNYFYKLKSYAKCFNTEINSFDMLVDISTLDMELRYTTLKICLDIEHSIKTYILRITTNNPDEDGYNIVENVINADENPQKFKEEIFSHVTHYDREKNEKYIENLYSDFYDNPPIWVILELANYGKLRGFLKDLSNKRRNNQDLRYLERSFKYINKLRNKCAHNTPLINKEIFSEENTGLPHYIVSSLGSDGVTITMLRRPFIANFAMALRAHKLECSPKSHEHRIMDLRHLLKRAQREKSLYKGTEFEKVYKEFEKIVDIYK